MDGYTVTLDGDLAPGQTSKLTLKVTKDGKPVTDLQPYLGAYGHLVALRAGDLAYLHVHPDGEPGDGKTTPGPDITFYAEVPSRATTVCSWTSSTTATSAPAEFTVHAGRRRSPARKPARTTTTGPTRTEQARRRKER